MAQISSTSYTRSILLHILLTSLLILQIFICLYLHNVLTRYVKAKAEGYQYFKKENFTENSSEDVLDEISQENLAQTEDLLCETIMSKSSSIKGSMCWNFTEGGEKPIDKLSCINNDDYCCNQIINTSSKKGLKESSTEFDCSSFTFCCVTGDISNTEEVEQSSVKDHIVLADHSLVTTNGLYFTQYKFGPMISPRAGCIKVYKGFIFIAWYRGGMDDRHLMLSRSKVGSSDWFHIEFPHQHIGFRGNHSMGDSHNTISIAICPINDSIHLLYDMHAYLPSNLPHDFFNYICSIDGAATFDENTWNIHLFYPKQNYLKKGEDYSRVTYPGFLTTSDGLLVAKYRVGGQTDATMFLNFYDGKSWSAPKKWNASSTYGIYGGFSIRSDGKMHVFFATRTSADRKLGYSINRGVYYAYSNYTDEFNTWFNLKGHHLTTPIDNVNILKLFDPAQPGDRYSNPSFTMTKDESLHFLTPIQRKGMPIALYFYKRKDDVTFRQIMIKTGDLKNVQGLLPTTHDTVFLVSLKNGRPMIQSAPGGTATFRTEYYSDQGPVYRNAVTNLWKDIHGKHHLFLCAMVDAGINDNQPIQLLHFLLPDTKKW